MSFSISQKKRFYQVYPQDTKTVVGRFHLVGSLVRQQSLFHSGAGEVINVCETSKEGKHAEEVFINDHAKIQTVTNLSPGEKATLSLTIKITHSPCSKCRAALLDFFASLPRNKDSQYNLCVQFANLYHESKSSANTIIQELAEWGRSFAEIGVRTVFKPFCVTKDPEFARTPLGITQEKFKEREMKDNNVTLHVQQIEELLKTDDLSHEFKKLSLKPRGTKNDGGDDSPPDDSGPQGPSGFPRGRGGPGGGGQPGPKGPSGQPGPISASIQQANELKTQGNTALKKGDVRTAIKLYTKAIQLDPNNHALYTNRSMALCRQAKYERALQDAETSIQLKADWTKGYYHKGTALRHLNRFSDASVAYEKALKLEPKNQEIKSALSVVNEKLMAQRIASGLSKGTGVDAPPRPPTKAEIQNERTRAAMEELHSEKKIQTLLRTGNALDSVPPAIRKALANCTSKKDVSSTEKLPTGTYVIHREKVKFPGGSVRCLSLHTRFEFSHQTVTKSGRVTIITNYYRVINEWK